MPVPLPNLDDRNFQQLMEDARRRIAQSCPEWTDLSPHDPGIVLLEVFAHLTEVMIYRLNRLPEKAYVEFLRLIGLRLEPPTAASVQLRFSRSRPDDRAIDIPRGTRVTVARAGEGSEAPVFATARRVTLEPGRTDVEVLAHHCDLVEAELAGHGTGLPGLSVTAQQPPLVAPTGDDLDLVVGVETAPGEADQRVPTVSWNGKAFRIWRAVESFADLGPDRFVYVVDRLSGTITFAVAVQMMTEGRLRERSEALAEVPPLQREIRLWYRRGGGAAGNLPAQTLTVLKDPIPSVQVTNPAAATGGRAAESLDNALLRGPLEMRRLERVVTADDYEMVAVRSSGAVTRAKAFAQASLWKHASPGTVEVLLVPEVPSEARGMGPVTAAKLEAHQTEAAQTQVQGVLDQRRPLGTTCVVNWARYKTVRVKARIVVHRGEDPDAVKARVLARLSERISPLPTPPHAPGWPFGRPLHVSQVYEVGLAEPGVSRVEDVSLWVDDVPIKAVTTLAADPFQPRTWYAGSADTLFRTVNDAEGWEPVGRFPDEEVDGISVHPERAGLLAAVTNRVTTDGGRTSRLHLSWDCGETWESPAAFAFRVNDTAWIVRQGVPVLLLATSVGLYEIALRDTSRDPVQVLVDPQEPGLGLYSVAASRNVLGQLTIAVGAQRSRGVYLSVRDAEPRMFERSGLAQEDVRVLFIQREGPRQFLWAGLVAVGDDVGKGCHRLELRGPDTATNAWQLPTGWQGGSCLALAQLGSKILAGTHRAGVLWLEADSWQPSTPNLRCGLPLRGAERLFHPVDALAGKPREQLLLAAGPGGVFRSRDEGKTYAAGAQQEFHDRVALPETWLFCSAEHEVEVRSEDETGGA